MQRNHAMVHDSPECNKPPSGWAATAALDICQDANPGHLYTAKSGSLFQHSAGVAHMNVSSLMAHTGITALEFDANSLQNLIPCPQYWLYPALPQFQAATVPATIEHNYLQAARHASRLSRGGQSGATLCLHFPATGGIEPAAFQALLQQEITLQGSLLGKLFQIEQLQFRGAINPTMFPMGLPHLLGEVAQHFQLGKNCQYLIEMEVNDDAFNALALLRKLGFSRLHLTLHSHNCSAHKAVQAHQLITLARRLQFDSITIEWLCHLPQQAKLGLARILKQILKAAPDQIRLTTTFPGHLQWCIKQLNAAQYHYLGSLTFARAQDPLVRAQLQGRLHRGQYGYALENENNHIACGLAGVGCLGNFYSQNQADFNVWQQQLRAGQLPLARELHLSMDDLLRRIIIHMLLCNLELSISALELAYPINFQQYFAHELQQLQTMVQQQWLFMDAEWLVVKRRGRLFINLICAVFDRYQKPGQA
jgi:oxygen-independent coproporphyrinogen-3 oxidase